MMSDKCESVYWSCVDNVCQESEVRDTVSHKESLLHYYGVFEVSQTLPHIVEGQKNFTLLCIVFETVL